MFQRIKVLGLLVSMAVGLPVSAMESPVQKKAGEHISDAIGDLHNALYSWDQKKSIESLATISTIYKDLGWQTEDIATALQFIQTTLESSDQKRFDHSRRMMALLLDAQFHNTSLFNKFENSMLAVMRAHKQGLGKNQFMNTLLKQPVDNLLSEFKTIESFIEQEYELDEEYKAIMRDTKHLLDELATDPESQYKKFFEHQSSVGGWLSYIFSGFQPDPLHLPTKFCALKDRFYAGVRSKCVHQEEKTLNKELYWHRGFNHEFMKSIQSLRQSSRLDNADTYSMVARYLSRIPELLKPEQYYGNKGVSLLGQLSNLAQRGQQLSTDVSDSLAQQTHDVVDGSKALLADVSTHVTEQTSGLLKQGQNLITEKVQKIPGDLQLQQSSAQRFEEKPLVAAAKKVALHKQASAISFAENELKNDGVMASILRAVGGNDVAELEEAVKKGIPAGLIVRSLHELITTYGVSNIVDGFTAYVDSNKATIDKDAGEFIGKLLTDLRQHVTTGSDMAKGQLQSLDRNIQDQFKKLHELVESHLQALNNKLQDQIIQRNMKVVSGFKAVDVMLENEAKQLAMSALTTNDRMNLITSNVVGSQWRKHEQKREHESEERLLHPTKDMPLEKIVPTPIQRQRAGLEHDLAMRVKRREEKHQKKRNAPTKEQRTAMWAQKIETATTSKVQKQLTELKRQMVLPVSDEEAKKTIRAELLKPKTATNLTKK